MNVLGDVYLLLTHFGPYSQEWELSQSTQTAWNEFLQKEGR